MIVIIDNDTGVHTAAYPLTSIKRIHLSSPPSIFNINIELLDGAVHLIPCSGSAHQKTIFTALTGGKTTMIIPPRRTEVEDQSPTEGETGGCVTQEADSTKDSPPL